MRTSFAERKCPNSLSRNSEVGVVGRGNMVQVPCAGRDKGTEKKRTRPDLLSALLRSEP